MTEKLDNFCEALRRLNEEQASYDKDRAEYKGWSWDWSGRRLDKVNEAKRTFLAAFDACLRERLAAIGGAK
jgi:hypothetical protein